MKHFIEKEKKFIELLGYQLIGPNDNNRWIIADQENNLVGYIQYKKIHNGNKKNGTPKIFGYHSYIDSSTISWELTRYLNDKFLDDLEDDNIYYSFDIKRNNQDFDHVEMNIGDNSTLTVWSKQYGFINFRTDFNGLFLNYKSHTDHYNLEEVLIYQNDDDDEARNSKKYVYQIVYCNKDMKLSDFDSNGRTTREICGIPFCDNLLAIIEKSWINGNLRTNHISNVKGTIEELALQNEMGMDSFRHFRFLINQIIPFQEDILSVMVHDDTIKENNLSIFFDDPQKEKIIHEKNKKL